MMGIRPKCEEGKETLGEENVKIFFVFNIRKCFNKMFLCFFLSIKMLTYSTCPLTLSNVVCARIRKTIKEIDM